MKTATKSVAAVIVTYNRKELLKEAIDALSNQDYCNLDIIVIDNASNDGTEVAIKSYLAKNRIKYYNTGENLGGAGGFNFGLKKAYELGYDYYWLMDDDCIVRKDTLTKFFEAEKSIGTDYGFLSSKVLWTDGELCVMNRQKKSFSRWLKKYNSNSKIAMASFVSLLIPSSIVREFGYPIKDFFIWTDDWEYTRRISREKPCYYVANSIVNHKCKQNIGASIADAPKDRLDRFNYLYRNDVYLYRREGLAGHILFKLRIALHKLRIKRSALPNDDKRRRLSLIDKAIDAGRTFNPQIEYPKDH